MGHGSQNKSPEPEQCDQTYAYTRNWFIILVNDSTGYFSVGFDLDFERRQLLGRLGNPEEVGEAAAFLASDEASYITGASLMVDNGMTALLESW